mmetsp:Transcript_34661/g.33849  ORF Transcript_34661/g.33849 Transcript_34661/m.33849 type:complete len:221 (+) Transcript_34661:1001-1663(+)
MQNKLLQNPSPAPLDLSRIKMEQLAKDLSAKEATHKQWDKHLRCFVIWLALIVMSLLRGSKNFPSIVGIVRCSIVDWSIQFCFLLLCVFMIISSVRRVQFEQRLKKEFGEGLVEGDIEFNTANLTKIVVFSILGGWVSGALGLGGGVIFNPLLLSMGVPPSVSSSTGMYLILYSTAASSFIYITYSTLEFNFGLWIGCWCCVGTMAGMKIMNYITKKYER